jgi:hypothetical protein
MDQITTALKSVLRPVQSLYNQAFNANKYAAGIGLSVIITTVIIFCDGYINFFRVIAV